MNEIIDLLLLASKVYSLLILARVIMSWVNPDPDNRLVQLIHRVTEPVLAPVRSILPSAGGMDFSPIVVLIGIQIAENLVVKALVGMATG